MYSLTLRMTAAKTPSRKHNENSEIFEKTNLLSKNMWAHILIILMLVFVCPSMSIVRVCECVDVPLWPWFSAMGINRAARVKCCRIFQSYQSFWAVKHPYSHVVLSAYYACALHYGKGYADYVNSTCLMLHCSILAHAHLLHPVQVCDPINQLAKKLVTLLAISLARCVKAKARCQKQNLLSPR